MTRKDTNGKPLETGKRYLCGPRGHKSRVSVFIEEDVTTNDMIVVSAQGRKRLDEISSSASFEPITPATQAKSQMMGDREYLDSVDRVAADLRRQADEIRTQIQNLQMDVMDHIGLDNGQCSSIKRTLLDWIWSGSVTVDDVASAVASVKKGSN